MTGPIRYMADRGVQTYFDLFDSRVEWMDMIYWLIILILALTCWQVWRKNKED